MATLVIGRDGHVDKLGGRVCVTERNDRDVDVARLFDRLGVGPRVRENDQTGLLEGAGDVVGEVPGGETAGDGGGTGVSSKLEDRPLTVGAGRDHTDVGWVINGGDDPGSQNDLFPRDPLLIWGLW